MPKYPNKYVAAIATAADIVGGRGYCDVSVILAYDDGTLTDRVYWGAEETDIRVDHPDVLSVVIPDAERLLTAADWRVSSRWQVAGDAIYASVEFA